MKNVYHHHINPKKVAGPRPVGHGRTSLFREDVPDDEWMAFVAARKWIAITHDYRLHRELPTLAVIKQHNAQVFYLWGAQAKKEETMRVFLNNRTKIIETAATIPGPFVFRIKARGPFERISLD